MVAPESTPCAETLSRSAQGLRLLQLLKENRLEMMVVTILLYSTGLLEKAYYAGAGVCI